MNRFFLSKLVLGIITFVPTAFGFFGRTDIIPRSYTVNAARELAGWQEHINDYDVDHPYWSIYMAPAYQRSFNSQQLNNFLLGGPSCFLVQGSRVPEGKAPQALLADYWGLPQDFKSRISFNPQISSFIWDMDFYLGYKDCYLRIHAPVAHTKWDLNLTECVELVGTYTYPAGYMAQDAVPRDQLASSFTEAISGEFRNRCKQLRPHVWGDMTDPLEYGRIQGRRNASRLSDIHVAAGWNFFNGSFYHGGLNARISIPAGTKPDARYFFQPIIGNGHHFEAGFGWTSHVMFWSRQSDHSYLGFWCDANVTHMFADTQLRSFDFCNNPGSRYILLSVLSPIENADVAVDNDAITKQYIGQLIPAINQTTLWAKISMNIQVDAVAKISWQIRRTQVDVGYNFWYRSAETLHELECIDPYLALKGDAQLYGFVGQAGNGYVLDQPIPLNVTQHAATLLGGQGDGNFVTGAEFANANADTPGLASVGAGQVLYQLNTTDAGLLAIAQQQISGSVNPIVLTNGAIDIDSALNPHAISHKIFASVARAWENESISFVPFLSCGVDVEWRCGCFASNSAISQWGIWAKGGLSY